MKEKKGQALVEFVIILPIFIFMLLAIIDVGKMIYVKNRLESEMDTVVELFHGKKTFDEINKEVQQNSSKTKLEIKNENNKFVTFYLKEEIPIITPFLNLIFRPPYEVKAERSIYYES
ncbi:MAG: pilus assembly protein [Bacilli bacterium]|nr:pilus assembly protein [Bacilli bacterium]